MHFAPRSGGRHRPRRHHHRRGRARRGRVGPGRRHPNQLAGGRARRSRACGARWPAPWPESFKVPTATVIMQTDVTASMELVERAQGAPRVRRAASITAADLRQGGLPGDRPQPRPERTPRHGGQRDRAQRRREPGHRRSHAARPDGAQHQGRQPHEPAAGQPRRCTTWCRWPRPARRSPKTCTKGTFTITNVGVFSSDGGTPILNLGESAIMCLGHHRPAALGTWQGR